jgi:hypothetical protein
MEHVINLPGLRLEVLFRALDRPGDIGKLLSLELTGAWVNEARELPFGLIQALDDRIGRFPAIKDGGATWRGMMMDTNPPDDDHWWYRLAEEDRPEGWEFFRQPGGLFEEGGKFVTNADAENLEWLEPDFYLERSQGKSKDHVRVYYCGRYGFVKEGKVVFPEYQDEVHCSKNPIAVDRHLPLYVGIDFGLTPAALFCQRTVTGRWVWVDELVTEDMGATRFAELLGPKIREEYAGFDVRIFGDPAGAERSQVDERTPFMILHAAKIMAEPAPTQDPIIRRDAAANPMTRMYDGLPGFLISPVCKIARKGLAGGYCHKRVQVSGEERYHDKPVKNRYSHVIEAGEYAMVGAGEGDKVIGWDVDIEDNEPWDAMRPEDGDRSAITGY